MKRNYLIAVVAICILIAMIWLLSSSKPKTMTGEIVTRGKYNSETTKTIMDDQGIEKWGFGLNGSSICFVDSAGLSLMRYDIASGKKDVLKKLSVPLEAASIQSNGSSCLFQTIASQSVSTFLYNRNGLEELKGYQRGIVENNGSYILQDEKNFVVIDSSGNEVGNISNTEGKIFAIAPTKEKTFLISDYDFELRKGKVVAQQDLNNQITPAENAAAIRGLRSTFLLVTQTENSFVANLFSGNSKILEISGVDPDLIKPVSSGYLVATKANAENPDKTNNGLVFIAENGTYQTIIHSVESSEEQFSINSFEYSNGIIYFSSGGKVASLKVDI